MRIGISAVSVESEAGFAKAGISRYALNLIPEMARLAPDVRFDAYVNRRFEAPVKWQDLPNLKMHRVLRYRTHRLLAGVRSSAQRLHAWFIPAYDVLRLCPAPQVCMIHDIFPLTHPGWFSTVRARQRAIFEAVACSKTLLANSEYTRRAVIERFGISAEKTIVTPLGVGNAPATPKPVGRSRPYVLSLGTWEPRKNITRLLQAWALVSGERPDVDLVLAGGRGWMFEDALQTICPRVEVLDYVPDEELPSLMSGAEFFVMPSLDEGFGMPVLEAMHFGAPLVLSNRGALRELAGDLPIYFDPESVDDIAVALRSGFLLKAKGQNLVRQGRERAARYSWTRTAELTLDALMAARNK